MGVSLFFKCPNKPLAETIWKLNKKDVERIKEHWTYIELKKWNFH